MNNLNCDICNSKTDCLGLPAKRPKTCFISWTMLNRLEAKVNTKEPHDWDSVPKNPQYRQNILWQWQFYFAPLKRFFEIQMVPRSKYLYRVLCCYFLYLEIRYIRGVHNIPWSFYILNHIWSTRKGYIIEIKKPVKRYVVVF